MKSLINIAERKLLLQDWRLLVFGFCMTFWSSPGQTYFVSLFGGAIRKDLELSHGEFGGIYSMATLASAALMLFTGPLVDRIDLKKISVCVAMGLALGCLSLSISHTVALLFLSIFILRHSGQGLMLLCSTTAMVRYFDEVKGKASSISGMGYPVSEAVIPSLLVILLSMVGWRQAWQIVAIIILLGVVPLIIWSLGNHQSRHARYIRKMSGLSDVEATVTARKHWTRSEVMRDFRLYLFLPGLLSQPLMFTGFFFHQVHLVEFKGWSLQMWGALFFLYATVSVASNLVCGMLIDRVGAIKIVPFFPIPLALGLFSMAFIDSTAVAVLFMICTGITVGFSSPLSTPFFSELYGTRHIGSIKSLTTAVMVLFTAISPVVIGALIDQGFAITTLMFWGGIYILTTSLIAGWARYKYV